MNRMVFMVPFYLFSIGGIFYMCNGIIAHDDMSFLKSIGLCIMGWLFYAIGKISKGEF